MPQSKRNKTETKTH